MDALTTYPPVLKFIYTGSESGAEQKVFKFSASRAGNPTEKTLGVTLGETLDYPEHVHRTLHSQGLAPEQFRVLELPGGFAMIEIEFLSPEDGWLNLEEVSILGFWQKKARWGVKLFPCLNRAHWRGFIEVPTYLAQMRVFL